MGKVYINLLISQYKLILLVAKIQIYWDCCRREYIQSYFDHSFGRGRLYSVSFCGQKTTQEIFFYNLISKARVRLI